MKRFYLILAALFIFALTGGYFLSTKTPEGFSLDRYAPQLPGGDFELQSTTGQVKLSDYRNKLVLIYFGYTHCPDICPTALALTTGALQKLDASELDQVQTLFISVDPRRDTPERMAEYAAFFHPDIIGLTGTKEQIDDIARRFGAYYSVADGASTDNYEVDHSSQTLVIGKDGQVKLAIRHGTASEEVLKIIREYL